MSAPPLTHVPRTKRGVISYAARDIGERLNAKALVAFTQSGDTVRRLARLHTPLPVLAFTPLPEVRSQLALTWGTETFIVPVMETTDGMIQQVDTALLEMERYQRGDLVVIVAGAPPGTVGSTNLIHVHRIGEDDH
ncbi:pyruvate kinase [Mycobacteroides abscessus subsp. massiliense]|nr:pyruvate kinase [Mycobacteroides abscessus subsp. massiliense]